MTRPIGEETAMPRGDKSAYTDKQKRQARHIEQGYEERGLSEKESERRAWATLNLQDGGGKKSGSGRSAARKKPAAQKATAKRAVRKAIPTKAATK
jgi:hypothetical protein